MDTPRKTNMSPKKEWFQVEIHLPTIDFYETFDSFSKGK